MDNKDHHGQDQTPSRAAGEAAGAAPAVSLPGLDLRFGSNAVRLSAWQWLVAALLLVLMMGLVPSIWERIEPLEDAADFRMPYELSYDYWLYQRHCRRSAGRGDVLVVGDSVIWGPYVTRQETLSHYLAAATGGRRRFANLGLDGAHPAALAGLVNSYGADIAGCDVILHCNLLWVSSPEHDLRKARPAGFNHPALVAQFYPDIPAYDETLSRRIGNVLDRNVTFFAWANHMRASRLGGHDLPTWSLDHPYDNPALALRPAADVEADKRHHPPLPWNDPSRGIRTQAFDWTNLEQSLQWRFFQATVATLKERGNRVVVVVGPFNEHMMEAESLAVYRRLRDQAAARLRQQGVACCVPPALPSELYGDASHPLAAGYARLAEWLVRQKEIADLPGGRQVADSVRR